MIPKVSTVVVSFLGVGPFVSFVPMEDLGIFTKKINVSKERKLSDVVGSYTYFADGDVLMAKITPCFENGKLGIAQNLKNGIGFGSSEFVVFRPKSEINPSYLYYLLTSDKFREEGRIKMSGAVGHKRVPKEYIENFEVLLPSITEQKRIVKILDEAFEKIAKAKENAEKNLQNSKELFDSFLMDIFSKLDCSTVLKDTAGVIGGFSFKSTDFLKHGKYQVIRMGNVQQAPPRQRLGKIRTE